jgi:hypothetical protein
LTVLANVKFKVTSIAYGQPADFVSARFHSTQENGFDSKCAIFFECLALPIQLHSSEPRTPHPRGCCICNSGCKTAHFRHAPPRTKTFFVLLLSGRTQPLSASIIVMITPFPITLEREIKHSLMCLISLCACIDPSCIISKTCHLVRF